MNSNNALAPYREHASRLYSAVLADVMDTLGRPNQALPPGIQALDPRSKILGRIRTLEMKRVAEIPKHPYAVELEAIDSLERGDVLLIKMPAHCDAAVWGELLSTACTARGAVGAVMNGPTRDIEKILELGFPVFADGASPLDSKGRIDGVGRDKPVRIGRVSCRPGDLLFGDRDGVVVIPKDVAATVLDLALEKVSGENTVRKELLAGRPVGEVFAKYGIL